MYTFHVLATHAPDEPGEPGEPSPAIQNCSDVDKVEGLATVNAFGYYATGEHEGQAVARGRVVVHTDVPVGAGYVWVLDASDTLVWPYEFPAGELSTLGDHFTEAFELPVQVDQAGNVLNAGDFTAVVFCQQDEGYAALWNRDTLPK